MLIKKHPILLSSVSILLIAALWFLFSWVSFLRTPLVTDDQGLKFTVVHGTSIKSVTHHLYVLNIIKHPRLFAILVALKGDKHELKAGEYLFPKGATPNSILMQITTGSGILYHTFTIIPGWSFRQLRAALVADEDLQHVSASLSDQAIMAQMGQPNLSPEGNFYPDTFYFVKGSSDIALLKRAFRMMQTKLNDAWAHREAGLPFKTSKDALNAASLVEKEAEADKDRPLIACVIINRLRIHMPLQLDPTVIYAAGSAYNGTIYRQQLQSKNPYNTYKHAGLPPTPIAIPSMESLQATLHPQHGNYLYFVAKNDGTGEHQFSNTLNEHNEAVMLARKKKFHPSFFNDALIRSYFVKLSLLKVT